MQLVMTADDRSFATKRPILPLRQPSEQVRSRERTLRDAADKMLTMRLIIKLEFRCEELSRVKRLLREHAAATACKTKQARKKHDAPF